MDTFLAKEATFAVVIDDNIIVMYPHKVPKTGNHKLSKSRSACKSRSICMPSYPDFWRQFMNWMMSSM